MDFPGIFLSLLSIAGSLALFLFGMKMMSESLQKSSGTRLKKILTTMTSNPLKGLLTGIIITTAVQFSSAVTIMVVSFINARFIKLRDSIAVIFGANIGTTLKMWVISILVLNISFDKLLFPLLGISLPLIFFRKGKFRIISEFLIGFALLFLGLEFLKQNLPSISGDSYIAQIISQYSQHSSASIFGFFIAGIVITAIFQSSSLILSFTFVMCSNGLINYEMGAAMVIGMNIGTTAATLLASVVANRDGQRAAMAHTLFNVIGSIWAFTFFGPFTRFIAFAVNQFEAINPYTNPQAIPIALAAFHTAFNVINTLLLIWFIPRYVKLLCIVVPRQKGDVEQYQLKHLKSPITGTTELNLYQVQAELAHFSSGILEMYSRIPNLLSEKQQKRYHQVFSEVVDFENIADTFKKNIESYLAGFSENEMSNVSIREMRKMYKIAGELEKIGDICYEMAKLIDKKNENKVWFTPEMRESLNTLHHKCDNGLQLMNSYLNNKKFKPDQEGYRDIYLSVFRLKEGMIIQNEKDVSEGQYPAVSGEFFTRIAENYHLIASRSSSVVRMVLNVENE